MPKKSENADQAEEAVQLQGGGAKDGGSNLAENPRQRSTRSRNVKIIIFAAVCCIVIVVIVALCAWYIVSTLNVTERGIIETIPGMYHYPESSSRSPDNLIIFKSYEKESYGKWVAAIDKFLSDYKKGGEYNVLCRYDEPPVSDQACFVDMKQFLQCNSENLYNYHRSSPCVFLKFNEIEDWVPEFYNDSSNLPENMPKIIKERIHELQEQNPSRLNNVWVSCDGETSADRELIGPLLYMPFYGFPGYYFPYKKVQKGYFSPLVALLFERPAYGVVISIECRVWARNIEYNREKGTGFVHFELLIN